MRTTDDSRETSPTTGARQTPPSEIRPLLDLLGRLLAEEYTARLCANDVAGDADREPA